MKNVDLKKRYKEDKIGLSPVRKVLILLFILPALVSKLSAQIPINGFCQLNSIKTKEGYKKFIALDYNGDNFSDLLLFGSDDKKAIIHQGVEKKILGNPIEKFSYYPLSEIVPLDRSSSPNRFYIFVSRKERVVGLVSFTKYGTLQLMNQKKLESYPNCISVGDADNDGKNEVLVSGSNFDGLSILEERNYILRENKIYKNRIFSEARFIDLDYDGYSDIVAVDLFTRSIIFLYNNQFEEFREYRSINVGEDIRNLRTLDLNSDGFRDFFYSSGSGIEILMGDSVSTFVKKITLETKVYPDSYIVSDFNRDKINDIAYLNKTTGDLYISYAKDKEEFYEPIHLLHQEGLVDLRTFRNSGENYLAVLSSKGRLYVFGRILSIDDEMQISICAEPKIISYYDSFKSNTKDLCTVDSYENKLILLVSDNGYFNKYYSFHLLDDYTNILVDDSRNFERTFYLFSYGNRNIQILNVNFSTNQVKSDLLYMIAPIIDVRLSKNKDSERENLFVLVNQDSNVSMSEIRFQEYTYSTTTHSNLIANVLDAALNISDSLSVFFWKRDKGILYNGLIDIADKSKIEKRINTFSIGENAKCEALVKSFNFVYRKKDLPISFVKVDDVKSVYFFDGIGNKEIHFEKNIGDVLDKNQVMVFNPSQGRVSYLYFYDRASGSFFESKTDISGSQLSFSKIFDSKNIVSYFVDNLFLGKTYLVYVESGDNSLKLKRVE